MEEEGKSPSRWRRFREKSRNRYRLVIMKDETFDEIGSYKLSPLNLYIALSTLLLILAILLFVLIAYTPLRKLVPGYGDVVARSEMNAMERTIVELNKQLDQQSLRTEALYRSTLGETGLDSPLIADYDSLPYAEEDDAADAPPPVAVSAEEMQLRREHENGRENSSGGSLIADTDSDKQLEGTFLIAPVNGKVSANFNPGDDHLGVDIVAPANTAVKACLGGVVFQSEYTSAHGYVVGIQHENNLLTFYKHNSQLLKPVGSSVRAGEAIAIIGNTGTRTSGPHLHFELWHRGKALDPIDYLSF